MDLENFKLCYSGDGCPYGNYGDGFGDSYTENCGGFADKHIDENESYYFYSNLSIYE